MYGGKRMKDHFRSLLSRITHFVFILTTRFEFWGDRGRRGKGGQRENTEKHRLGLWAEKKGRKNDKEQSEFVGLQLRRTWQNLLPGHSENLRMEGSLFPNDFPLVTHPSTAPHKNA